MKRIQSTLLLFSIAAMFLLVSRTASAGDTGSLLHDEGASKAAMADITAAYKELNPLLGKGEAFTDEAKRVQIAPKAIPLIQRIVAAYDLLNVHVLRTAGGVEFKFRPLAMLAYFGDAKTRVKLAENAASADAGLAIEAQAALALSDWFKTAHDPVGQQKVLDSLKTAARQHPTDDQFTIALLMMANTGAATPAMADAAKKLIVDELKGGFAQQLSKTLQAETKLKLMEGKPLVIAGKALDGTDFSTASWKGKVILVDFWASWCGPCKVELPKVKKVYADYHAKGLEVLGVSCDRGAGPLHSYLAQNPEMAWPQLFDPAKPGWHAIATDFGIRGIPTMFLIDKAGVVRSVTARKDFEEMIPKLLEEK